MIIKTRTQICKKRTNSTKVSFNNIWKHIKNMKWKKQGYGARLYFKLWMFNKLKVMREIILIT